MTEISVGKGRTAPGALRAGVAFLVLLGAATPALPQQIEALRGELAGREVLPGPQLAPPEGDTADPGGTPDPLADGQLRLTGEEPDGGTSPAATPTTARQRAQERKARVAAPVSTAERLEEERRRRMQAAAANQDPDTTGTVRTPTVDSQEVPERADPDSERAEAIEGLNRQASDNPYAPVGLRIGTFDVVTTLESGLTWTDNANTSPDGRDALLSESTLRLNARSEQGGDLTAFNGTVNYRTSLSGEEIDETRARIDADLQRDLGGDWRALAALAYEVGPESASAPGSVSGAVDQPIRHLFEGSLGAEKDVGKLKLRLTGNVEREIFGDAELETGQTISQADRDSTLGALVLRTGYEISPALTPFVELEYGRRVHDDRQDSNGYERSATRAGARAGLAFDLGEKFNGEAAAGWIEENPDDDRLAVVSGPSIAAAIAWSPWRGTNVRFDGSTIVEGATDPGESGSLLYTGRLALTRELRANLTADAGVGLGYRDYFGIEGHDTIFNADASLTWWLNRYAGLTGRLRHEQLSSTLPDRDYTANGVFLGLKVQR